MRLVFSDTSCVPCQHTSRRDDEVRAYLLAEQLDFLGLRDVQFTELRLEIAVVLQLEKSLSDGQLELVGFRGALLDDFGVRGHGHLCGQRETKKIINRFSSDRIGKPTDRKGIRRALDRGTPDGTRKSLTLDGVPIGNTRRKQWTAIRKKTDGHRRRENGMTRVGRFETIVLSRLSRAMPRFRAREGVTFAGGGGVCAPIGDDEFARARVTLQVFRRAQCRQPPAARVKLGRVILKLLQ